LILFVTCFVAASTTDTSFEGVAHQECDHAKLAVRAVLPPLVAQIYRERLATSAASGRGEAELRIHSVAPIARGCRAFLNIAVDLKGAVPVG